MSEADRTLPGVSAVTAGETFRTKAGTRNWQEYTVSEGCGTNDGHWYCVTHDELFATQIAKDSHIEHGTHRLTWVCWTHGPEVP